MTVEYIRGISQSIKLSTLVQFSVETKKNSKSIKRHLKIKLSQTGTGSR